MTARLSDEQLEQALQACVPSQAPVSSADRLFETVATTRQDRPLPIVLAQLRDVDPVGRRRSLLIAAALLLALTIATATAVGAWRLMQRDAIDEFSLEPPADVPAFVLSSYEWLHKLPPVALTWRDSNARKGRIYVDRSGAVRFDKFASADAAEPASYRILSPNHRLSGVASVGADAVWVEPGHEAIGDDPRVHIRGVLSAGDWPGCEIERDPSTVGSPSLTAGWRYVGLEVVAGRPTRHVACVGDLWIDIETRLILRTRQPMTDGAGQSIPGRFETTEVTDIAFGEQPAALFQPPDGLARMSEDEYGAYVCARDLPNELTPGISDCAAPQDAKATPPHEPSPTPMPTERPNASDCKVPPADLNGRSGPVAWTPERLKEDWPAPVRHEPAGGGGIEPLRVTYLDPIHDTGSDAFACVDIRWVMGNTSEVHLKLAAAQSVIDPADAWIAYGVVTDDDRDGVPDWRYGIDNIPVDAADHGPPTRGWRTDLHSGRTDTGPEHDEMVWSAYGEGTPMGRGPKSGYPRTGSDAGFLFGGAFETTTGSADWGMELDMPFYAWASVIVDGRVVATDYAPDAGWLVAARGSGPGGAYRLGDPFPDLSMTVPAGWTTSSASHSTRIGGVGELRRVACGGLPRGYPQDTAFDADCALVKFEMIDAEADVRCGGAIKTPIGSHFDDLLTHVADVLVVTQNEDVTVDRYRGKHLEYSSVKGDLSCKFSDYGEVWILDVDGVPLMILSGGGDLELDVPQKAVKAEIRQMVESIRFGR